MSVVKALCDLGSEGIHLYVNTEEDPRYRAHLFKTGVTSYIDF